jgi:hypothetical protein
MAGTVHGNVSMLITILYWILNEMRKFHTKVSEWMKTHLMYHFNYQSTNALT